MAASIASRYRRHWFAQIVVALCLWTAAQRAAADDTFRVLAPNEGASHPVVLFVPGCSGFKANNGVNHYESRAAELRDAGYVVVFVDYVERRMQDNCAHVSIAEVAGDIIEAAYWARRQPNVDATRIAVIGWSFGGGGVLAALKAMGSPPPIARAVMYYPVCRGMAPWPAPVTGLMLLGQKDDVAPPAVCKPVMDGVPAEHLRVISYAGARHGFDVAGLRDHADPHPGAPVYNDLAAKESWAAVLAFLRER